MCNHKTSYVCLTSRSNLTWNRWRLCHFFAHFLRNLSPFVAIRHMLGKTFKLYDLFHDTTFFFCVFSFCSLFNSYSMVSDVYFIVLLFCDKPFLWLEHMWALAYYTWNIWCFTILWHFDLTMRPHKKRERKKKHSKQKWKMCNVHISNARICTNTKYAWRFVSYNVCMCAWVRRMSCEKSTASSQHEWVSHTIFYP